MEGGAVSGDGDGWRDGSLWRDGVGFWIEGLCPRGFRDIGEYLGEEQEAHDEEAQDLKQREHMLFKTRANYFT